MAIPLETLVVQIAADIGDFKNKMAVAEKTTSATVAKTSSALGSSMAQWAKWAVAAVGAYKAANSVIKQFAIVDDLAKQADALNMNIKAYAAFQYAGKLAGVSVEELRMSLQYMTKNLGEAARGTGEAKDALTDLGLDARSIISLSIDDQFRLISDAIAGLSTSAEQAAVTMRLFGRGGMRTLNLIQQGAGALDDAKRATEAYGTAITRLDARKIEDVNDAVVEAKEAWTGLVRSLMVDTAPALVEVIHGMAGAVDVFKIAWYGLQEGISYVLYGITWSVGKVAEGITGIINLAITGINKFAVIGRTVSQSIGDKLQESFGKKRWDEIQQGFRLLGAQMDRIRGTATIDKPSALTEFALLDTEALRKSTSEAVALMADAADEADKRIGEIEDRMLARKRAWDELAASAKARAEGFGAPTRGGAETPGGTAQTLLDQLRAEQALRLEIIDDGLNAEERAAQESFMRRIDAIQKFEAQYTETSTIAADLRAEAEKRYIAEVEKANRESRLRQAQYAVDTAQFVIGQFQMITGAMEEGSEAQFKANKALAIAEAVVNTAAAVTTIWREHAAHPWLAGTLTALAVAAGAAQIAKIRATEYQSGGGGGAVSAPSASGAGASAAAQGGGGGGGGRAREVNVTIVGDMFSGGGLRGFLERLNEELDDNVELRVRTS